MSCWRASYILVNITTDMYVLTFGSAWPVVSFRHKQICTTAARHHTRSLWKPQWLAVQVQMEGSRGPDKTRCTWVCMARENKSMSCCACFANHLFTSAITFSTVLRTSFASVLLSSR